MGRMGLCKRGICEKHVLAKNAVNGAKYHDKNDKNIMHPYCNVCEVTFTNINIDFSKIKKYTCPCCKFPMRTRTRWTNTKKKLIAKLYCH